MTPLQQEMLEAGREADGVYVADQTSAELAVEAAYAVVEPLLLEIVRASKTHRFLPDLDRAVARLEEALGETH